MPISGSADPGTIVLDGMAFKLAKAKVTGDKPDYGEQFSLSFG